MLDDVGVPYVGGVRVEAGVTEGTPLPQQVPALVEVDLELLEPPAIVVGDFSLRLTPPELLPLRDELLDRRVWI